MKRRDFIAAGAAVGAGVLSISGQKNPADEQEYIEMIKYQLPIGPNKNRVRDFYRDVAIPALNRLGLDRIGVMVPKYGHNQPSLYIIIPHPSLESVFETPQKLLQDKEYVEKGADFLNTPLANPAYVRVEKSLFKAFKYLPKVQAPTELLDKGRVFEMRIYESHSDKYGQKKIEMFNEGGEIAIFKKTGLLPVFFGEALIGQELPNLTYMLAFENMEKRDAAWSVFVKSPEWRELSRDPQYKDTVSNITDIILSPDKCSQV